MVAVVQSRPTAPLPAPGVGVAAARPAAHRADVSELTYRRRRAAAAAIVVALFLAVQGLLATVGGGATIERPAPVADARFSAYVVQPGDTFWEIARRLDPAADPRPLVARLVAAHGSPILVPGERLALPAS